MAHKRSAILVSTGLAALIFAPDALAQGCALCYNTAASQSPEAAKQLNYAILALLIPTLSLFCGVLCLAFRRRDADREEETSCTLPLDEPAIPGSRGTQSVPASRIPLLPPSLS